MKLQVTIKCPQCAQPVTIQMDSMKPGHITKCPSCGAELEHKGDDLSKTQQAFDSLQTTLKKMK